MPCQPTLYKHLADLQQTRAEMQAGARHMFDVYDKAKHELHKYKVLPHSYLLAQSGICRFWLSAVFCRASLATLP